MIEYNNLRTQCWDYSFYAFATASLLERRVKKYKIGINILAFLGLAQFFLRAAAKYNQQQ